VYLVPLMYVRLLHLPEEVRACYDLSSLRFVASTGSPCAPGVVPQVAFVISAASAPLLRAASAALR
jgi:acyl-coenzyme A synthetase/AMP-(fatty) acid ligase